MGMIKAHLRPQNSMSPYDGILACMDVTKMVASLHEELRGLKLAIEALEAIAAGRGSKRRGRPPKSESMSGGHVAVKRRGRPPGSKNKKKTEGSES